MTGGAILCASNVISTRQYKFRFLLETPTFYFLAGMKDLFQNFYYYPTFKLTKSFEVAYLLVLLYGVPTVLIDKLPSGTNWNTAASPPR